MSTVERPLMSGMRRALEAARRGYRAAGIVTRLVKVGNAPFVILALVLVAALIGAFAVFAGSPSLVLLYALVFLLFLLLLAGGAAVSLVRSGRVVKHGLAEIEQDLADGACLETVGDAEVEVGNYDSRPSELRLPDRTISSWDQVAFRDLRRHSPLRGVTVRYTPHAQLLLEIVDPDGRALYRVYEGVWD